MVLVVPGKTNRTGVTMNYSRVVNPWMQRITQSDGFDAVGEVFRPPEEGLAIPCPSDQTRYRKSNFFACQRLVFHVMIHRFLNRTLLAVLLFTTNTIALAQDGKKSREPESAKSAKQVDSPAVKALEPLFRQLKQAKSSRTTVELSADTIVDGAVIGSQKSSYQIASLRPNQFTVYLKDEERRTRIYSNGKQATIALSPSAYTVLDKPILMQEAVFNLPIPMGPYPEAVLSMSLAGIDPGQTFTTGMKSVTLVDRKRFRGEQPAIHFAGVQDDDVKWDLWITQDVRPKPLRLMVDLTEMLRANGDLQLTPGYQFVLRFDFKLWHLNNRTDPNLFVYKPIKGSKQYKSIEAYYESLAEEQEDSDQKKPAQPGD